MSWSLGFKFVCNKIAMQWFAMRSFGENHLLLRKVNGFKVDCFAHARPLCVPTAMTKNINEVNYSKYKGVKLPLLNKIKF